MAQVVRAQCSASTEIDPRARVRRSAVMATPGGLERADAASRTSPATSQLRWMHSTLDRAALVAVIERKLRRVTDCNRPPRWRVRFRRRVVGVPLLASRLEKQGRAVRSLFEAASELSDPVSRSRGCGASISRKSYVTRLRRFFRGSYAPWRNTESTPAFMLATLAHEAEHLGRRRRRKPAVDASRPPSALACRRCRPETPGISARWHHSPGTWLPGPPRRLRTDRTS